MRLRASTPGRRNKALFLNLAVGGSAVVLKPCGHDDDSVAAMPRVSDHGLCNVQYLSEGGSAVEWQSLWGTRRQVRVETVGKPPIRPRVAGPG